MGNCCCVPKSKKRNSNRKLRKGSSRSDAKRRYHKYAASRGDNVPNEDGYYEEEEDEQDVTFDYDRQTTQSSLSTSINKSLYSEKKNKLLLKNHSQLIAQKQQQQQQARQNAAANFSQLAIVQTKTTAINSSNLLYLQQSHLAGSNTASGNFSSSNQSSVKENCAQNDLAAIKDLNNELKKKANCQDSKANRLKRPINGVETNLDLDTSKLSKISSRSSSAMESSSSSVSISPTSVSSSSLLDPASKKYNEQQKANKIEPNSNDSNSKRLSNRKRSNYLNQSLNETDLSANKSLCSDKYLNNRRKIKIKSKKISEGIELEELEEYNSDDALKSMNKPGISPAMNNSNYRSLQKSKRSIKTIEKTIKNSKSIEKWLNEFEKTKEANEQRQVEPMITEETKLSSDSVAASSPDTSKICSNESLYESIGISQTPETPKEIKQFNKLYNEIGVQLSESVERVLKLNRYENVRNLETDMYSFIKKLILPKSLANLDDISFLKWFFNQNNFDLFVQQPIIGESSNIYIMKTTHLQIELADETNSISSDMDSPTYMVYSPSKKGLYLLTNKIKYIQNKEKELSTAVERQFDAEQRQQLEELRRKHIDTSNFVGSNCLNGIFSCKNLKNENSKQTNSALTGVLNSSTISSSSSSSSSGAGGNFSNYDSNLCPVNLDEISNRLFLCFLCNFSCKLVESFLFTANQQANNVDLSNASNLSPAGFIRKHKLDRTFSFIVNTNENVIRSSKLKFMFKLNKWPKEYDFAKRNRSISEKIITYISNNACLISAQSQNNSKSLEIVETDLAKWLIDTSLAETLLFKGFSRLRILLFSVIYFIFNNLNKITSDDPNSTNEFDRRILLHHVLHFYDHNNQIDENISTYEHLCRFLTNFSIFLRTHSLKKHKTINRPNYFNTSLEIITSDSENSSIVSNGQSLEARLVKLESYLKKGARFYELSLEQAFNGKRATTAQTILKRISNEEMFNKYLVDFYRVLFNRFRCKRDNFKINEQVLMDIHSCVSREQNDIDLSEVDLSGVDLLTKFELYAECVHKYLPQIRQHNQYLLFHYIWTMQVQYLAPFFNYICDFYRAYN